MKADSYQVRTARGTKTLVPSGGHTLPHEHIIVDVRVWWTGEGDWQALDPPGVDPPALPDEVVRAPEATSRENMVLNDWYVGAKELRLARDSGCQLLVDVTTQGLDPRPDLAVRAADLAGLDVVVSVGRYLDDALSDEDREVPVEELTERWVRQAAKGVAGYVPGMIGEIGTGPVITGPEVISLRAAARAQQATGLPINVHVHPYARKALEALKILADEGADLSRVAVSHCDGELDADWLLRVLETSCYVEMDLFGTGPTRLIQGRGFPSDQDRIRMLHQLCDRGWSHRLLLSQDICHRNSLTRYGGWGYGHIGHSIAPMLAEELGARTAEELLAVNPLRLLDMTGRGEP